jgi:hypothetical protein
MSQESQHYPINETTRRIIDQMTAAGFRQGKDYIIEFAFFGDSASRNRLRDYLVANGYTEDNTQSDEMLIVTLPVTLTHDAIGKALHEVKALAHRYGVGFDGWSVDARQAR